MKKIYIKDKMLCVHNKYKSLMLLVKFTLISHNIKTQYCVGSCKVGPPYIWFVFPILNSL